MCAVQYMHNLVNYTQVWANVHYTKITHLPTFRVSSDMFVQRTCTQVLHIWDGFLGQISINIHSCLGQHQHSLGYNGYTAQHMLMQVVLPHGYSLHTALALVYICLNWLSWIYICITTVCVPIATKTCMMTSLRVRFLLRYYHLLRSYMLAVKCIFIAEHCNNIFLAVYP